MYKHYPWPLVLEIFDFAMGEDTITRITGIQVADEEQQHKLQREIDGAMDSMSDTYGDEDELTERQVDESDRLFAYASMWQQGMGK